MVAVGAAIQGAVLTGEVKDVLLLDVTPLSLGIETMGGVMTRLIEAIQPSLQKNQKYFLLPAITSPAYRYMYCRVNVRWRRIIRALGIFNLDGIPPAPRGVPQIEVTFDIDANGILHVTAKDKGTGKEQKIRIEAGSGLSKRRSGKMKAEAKANEATDKAEKEKVEN